MMNSTGSGTPPGTGGDSSWTDETLPMGIRKALLEQELRKHGIRKRQAPAASASHQEGPLHRPRPFATGHPVADAPTGDDKAS